MDSLSLGCHITSLTPLGTSNISDLTAWQHGALIAGTEDGHLYSLNGHEWSPISTPKRMIVTGACFRSSTEGILIGQTTDHAREGSQTTTLIVLLIAILLIGSFIYAVIRLVRRRRWWLLFATGLLVAALVAGFLSILHQSRGFSFEPGSHFVAANQPNAEIAITHDGGRHWWTTLLASNFYLTSAAPIDSGYLISSYANKSHLDGDLWKVSSDTARRPLLFAACRALWGIEENDRTIYAYGTDVSVSIVGNPWAKVPGQILVMRRGLDSLHVINLPGHHSVISLSLVPGSNEVWFVDEQHQLFRMDGNQPIAIRTPSEGILMQVRVATSGRILVLDSLGTVNYSNDSGTTWQGIDLGTTTHIHHLFIVDTEIYVAGNRGYVGRIVFD